MKHTRIAEMTGLTPKEQSRIGGGSYPKCYEIRPRNAISRSRPRPRPQQNVQRDECVTSSSLRRRRNMTVGY